MKVKVASIGTRPRVGTVANCEVSIAARDGSKGARCKAQPLPSAVIRLERTEPSSETRESSADASLSLWRQIGDDSIAAFYGQIDALPGNAMLLFTH